MSEFETVDTYEAIPCASGCSLSLRIMPGDARCDQYRKAGSASCWACTAWASPSTPPVEEKRTMPKAPAVKKTTPSTPKIYKSRCKVAGCTRQMQTDRDGMCKRHYTMARNEAGLSGNPAITTKSDAVVALPENFGKVRNADGVIHSFGVDEVIFLALDEAFAAKRHDWLVELSGLKPGKAIMAAAQMVQAIEGLEHP